MVSSSNREKVRVQPLAAGQLDQALALSQAVQWPYKLEDWQFAHALGHAVCVELDGRLAATALWWPYGETFASAGMIIVAAEAQRRGIGAALMDELLAQADGRSIILNSTDEGLALYTRLGFVANGAVHQHQAVLERAPAIVGSFDLIRNLQDDDVAAVVDLDRQASGMEREPLLVALIDLGAVRVIERQGRVAGYCCVRKWGRGIVIGPVVAPDLEAAQALIADAAAGLEGQFVRVDVTLSSGLSSWLEEIGLPQVGQVTSMSRGPAPRPGGEARIYALSNQSLG